MNDMPVRKNIRLDKQHYTKDGYFYVTMNTKGNKSYFGKIVDAGASVGTSAPARPQIELSKIGQCLHDTIIVANKNGVMIDKFVIMPNHVHLIIVIENDLQHKNSLQQVVKISNHLYQNTQGFPYGRRGFMIECYAVKVNTRTFGRILMKIFQNGSRMIIMFRCRM